LILCTPWLPSGPIGRSRVCADDRNSHFVSGSSRDDCTRCRSCDKYHGSPSGRVPFLTVAEPTALLQQLLQQLHKIICSYTFRSEMTKVAYLLFTWSHAIWFHILFQQTYGQIAKPYEDLSDYPQWVSDGGEFSWPDGHVADFDEGSKMTISWNTSFSSVSLYCIYERNMSLAASIDGVDKSQRQLASKLL